MCRTTADITNLNVFANQYNAWVALVHPGTISAREMEAWRTTKHEWLALEKVMNKYYGEEVVMFFLGVCLLLVLIAATAHMMRSAIDNKIEERTELYCLYCATLKGENDNICHNCTHYKFVKLDDLIHNLCKEEAVKVIINQSMTNIIDVKEIKNA